MASPVNAVLPPDVFSVAVAMDAVRGVVGRVVERADVVCARTAGMSGGRALPVWGTVM